MYQVKLQLHDLCMKKMLAIKICWFFGQAFIIQAHFWASQNIKSLKPFTP